MTNLNKLENAVLTSIGKPEDWPKWRGGWAKRADLALLDAIYSTRQKYETTVLPKMFKWQELNPSPIAPELEYLANTPEKEIEEVFGRNVLPGFSLRRRRKSVGVIETAKRLCSAEMNFGSADLICRAVEEGERDRILKLLRSTKGVGYATASYFLILLGIDGVKVDTLLGGWVRSILEQPDLQQESVSEIVSALAKERFHTDAKNLDYAIWRHVSISRGKNQSHL
jgi:hypothetical protein